MNIAYDRKEKFFLIAASICCVFFYLYYSNYSALLYPFYDHVETYMLIEKFQLNQISMSDLIVFHNEHLPVVSRCIFLFLSFFGMNMRSQFFVMNVVHISILLAFIMVFLKFNDFRGFKGFKNLNFFIFLIISILVLNPSGSTNWWWSFMLEILLATLFSVLSFILYSSEVRFSSLYAALFAIFAIFSQAMGLLIAPVILCLSFYKYIFSFKKNIYDFIFWLFFSVISFYFYLNNVHFSSTQHPSILVLVCYVAVFIGKAFLSIFYPLNNSMWGGSSEYVPQLICGSISIFLSVYMICISLQKYSSKDRLVNLSILLIMFSLSVAVVTGWGRAGMPGESITHANSQPTYLIASLFFIGLLGLFTRISYTWEVQINPIIIRFALIFLIFSFCFVWVKSIPIYREARNFNEVLRAVYKDPENNVNAYLIHPNIQIRKHVINFYCSQSICN